MRSPRIVRKGLASPIVGSGHGTLENVKIIGDQVAVNLYFLVIAGVSGLMIAYLTTLCSMQGLNPGVGSCVCYDSYVIRSFSGMGRTMHILTSMKVNYIS